jgi:hypothetical protein
MCYNCGRCDHEPLYNGDDSIDAAEQNTLFGLLGKEMEHGKSY